MLPDLRPDKATNTGGDSRTVYMVGVIVPLAIALATGLFVGLAVAYLFYQFGSRHPVEWGIGVALVAIPAVWLQLVMGRMIPIIERMFGVDLNGDGQIAAPPEPPLTVNLRSPDGRETQIARLPIPADKRREFARGMLQGKTTVRFWTARGISQIKYGKIVDEMLARGIAVKATGKGEIEITPAGRQMFEQYLNGNDAEPESVEPARAYANDAPSPTLRRRGPL